MFIEAKYFISFKYTRYIQYNRVKYAHLYWHISSVVSGQNKICDCGCLFYAHQINMYFRTVVCACACSRWSGGSIFTEWEVIFINSISLFTRYHSTANKHIRRASVRNTGLYNRTRVCTKAGRAQVLCYNTCERQFWYVHECTHECKLCSNVATDKSWLNVRKCKNNSIPEPYIVKSNFQF